MGIVQGSDGQTYWVEQGVPADYAARGATTVAQYQTLASQDLSDKQIAAQKAIADQQNQLNEQQFQAQQDQYAQQQQQVQDQATRQTAYDTGRADLLGQGTQQVNDAFAKFSPDYFTKYAQDYMSKAQDDIQRQQDLAQKQLGFQLARQGISASQAGVNEQGLLEETSGRATAEQTAAAQQAQAALQSNVAGAKQNLLNQVTASESIGSPIAGSSIQDVNNALQTQRSAISGVTSSAGDVTASLQAVPTVSPISNIFSGVLGGAGSFLGGQQQAATLGAFNRGVAGLSAKGPNVSSTT